jgi:hypothetical protein
MSIALAWCDFKTYCEEVGPGRAEPPRPAQCVFCAGGRVWFNGGGGACGRRSAAECLAARRRNLLPVAAGLRGLRGARRLRLGRAASRHRRRVRPHPARPGPHPDGGGPMTTAPAIDLDALLRRLHLPTVRRLYPDLAQRAEREGLSRLPRRAHGRRGRPPGPDPHPALRASRALSLPQDDRRVRLHPAGRRPMVFTTNKPLGAWGRVLHDPDLAEAILDRVLERGRHLELRGASYRTRHLKLDLTQAVESASLAPARISGNHRPQFPEPTAG